MQDGPTISNLPQGHNLTTSRVEINMPAYNVSSDTSLVKVLIKYPIDWKKDKFFKDGDIKEVSPETAATFMEIGIATLFNPDAPVTQEANGSQEQVNVTLADPSVLDSPVKGYENTEEQATAVTVAPTETETPTEAETSTETKKGAKKTAGK